MSRVNPRLVFWIAGLFERKKLTAAYRDVLVCLGTRKLDYGTGRGYCSVNALAESTGLHERTVRRALDLARNDQPALLERTKRGHRLGDGRVIASEWQVIYPPMSTGHQGPVEASLSDGQRVSTGQSADLNRTEAAPQPDTRAAPSGSEATTGSEAFTTPPPSPPGGSAGKPDFQFSADEHVGERRPGQIARCRQHRMPIAVDGSCGCGCGLDDAWSSGTRRGEVSQ